MKKIISFFIISTLSLVLGGCVNTVHYPDNAVEKDKLAFLDTISKGDDHITILRINGKASGDWWNGPVGDHYVKYGKIQIKVQYHNNTENYVAYTSLTFNTVAGKTYKVSSSVDYDEDEVTISVTENGKVLTKKTVSLIIQEIPIMIPIIIMI